MSYPTVKWPWQFSVNHVVSGAGSVAEHNARVLLAIKNAMVDTGWIVTMSSNAAERQNYDLWAGWTDLRWYWEPYPHSWIVLGKNDLYICIDLMSPYGGGSDGRFLTMVASHAGFVGGTVGFRPHPVDPSFEFMLLDPFYSGGQWGGSGTTAPQVVHALGTTTGRTRVFTCIGGGVHNWWWFDRVGYPESLGNWWLEYPIFALKIMDSSFATLSDAANCHTFLPAASITLVAYLNLTNPSYDSTSIGRQSSTELNGAYPLADVWAFSTTFGRSGYYGRIDDLWFGGGGAQTGDTSNTFRFAYFGNLVVPWNGTIPNVAGGISTDRPVYYVQDADIYSAAYGEPAGEYHQRCRDTGAGSYLYWWSQTKPDIAYPYTPPVGPTTDVCVLAEFAPLCQ